MTSSKLHSQNEKVDEAKLANPLEGRVSRDQNRRNEDPSEELKVPLNLDNHRFSYKELMEQHRGKFIELEHRDQLTHREGHTTERHERHGASPDLSYIQSSYENTLRRKGRASHAAISKYQTSEDYVHSVLNNGNQVEDGED